MGSSAGAMVFVVDSGAAAGAHHVKTGPCTSNHSELRQEQRRFDATRGSVGRASCDDATGGGWRYASSQTGAPRQPIS